MAEWLVEDGIGETRALLIEADEVLAAKLHWPGELVADQVVEAKLTHRAAGRSRGTAVTDDGTEILLDRLPRDAAEGARIAVRITRAALAERGRYKRAQGRFTEHSGKESEHNPVVFGCKLARFPSNSWESVWNAAWDGEVAFAGGALLFAVTPGMIVVDVDGDLRPAELAHAAVEPLARASRQFDCGGSIGIDFPTLDRKADRKAVDAALEQALAGWPHERTAMNGFGFVQIVARLTGPSLLHRMATQRTEMAARMALRRAEICEGTGRMLELAVHPAIGARLRPEWLKELARRTGKQVRIAADPAIALEAGHAQMLER